MTSGFDDAMVGTPFDPNDDDTDATGFDKQFDEEVAVDPPSVVGAVEARGRCKPGTEGAMFEVIGTDTDVAMELFARC